MIKFERIQPGDTLWDCHRYKMGNTTMSRMGAWPVEVISVDPVARTAVVRWNHNAPETWSAHRLRKLSRKKSAAAIRDEGRRW